ncbi:MAG TPA: complex I NDUFA9 subunit family protein [Verrucomicrobiota bacterium]|nr:complex I NDUFA9 subunit family protein [Verrucomicrobiota bacterium]
MKVLVTGATGFVGSEVLRQLHDAGHAPRVVSRNTQSPRVRNLVPAFATELRTGDVLLPDSLKAACDGVDGVIHLVGIISETGQQTFEKVHMEGTRNIVTAAQRAGAKHFIHMSALGTRPDAVSRYHKSKWAAEEIVRGSGLDWTIFRPSIIYGPGDGFVNLFARMSRFSPALPLIGGGRSKFAPIPVADVARCFVKSLTEPRSIRQTFDLCGYEVLTLRQIVETILAVTNRKRLKLPLPFGIAQIQAMLLEFFCGTILRRPPPLNRDQLLMLQEDNVGNGQPAAELFGLGETSFEKGIAAYLRRGV